MALSQPKDPTLAQFTFFVSRRREDGRERFRLHMGYFETQQAAEEMLAVVREVYPRPGPVKRLARNSAPNLRRRRRRTRLRAAACRCSARRAASPRPAAAKPAAPAPHPVAQPAAPPPFKHVAPPPTPRSKNRSCSPTTTPISSRSIRRSCIRPSHAGS